MDARVSVQGRDELPPPGVRCFPDNGRPPGAPSADNDRVVDRLPPTGGKLFLTPPVSPAEVGKNHPGPSDQGLPAPPPGPPMPAAGFPPGAPSGEGGAGAACSGMCSMSFRFAACRQAAADDRREPADMRLRRTPRRGFRQRWAGVAVLLSARCSAGCPAGARRRAGVAGLPEEKAFGWASRDHLVPPAGRGAFFTGCDAYSGWRCGWNVFRHGRRAVNDRKIGIVGHPGEFRILAGGPPGHLGGHPLPADIDCPRTSTAGVPPWRQPVGAAAVLGRTRVTWSNGTGTGEPESYAVTRMLVIPPGSPGSTSNPAKA